MSEPTRLGEGHVTQTRTCHRCSRFAGRGHVDADARLRLAGWLVRGLGLGLGWWLGSPCRMGSRMASWLGTCLGVGTWMAFRLGMEWTALRRGTRILWKRMPRPAVGPRPMGTTQDSRQQVLVKNSGLIFDLSC